MSLIGLNDFLSLVGSVNPNDPASIADAAAPAQTLIPQIIAANHTVAATAFNLGIDTVIYETLARRSASSRSMLPPEVQTIGRSGRRLRQCRTGG